IQKFTQRQEVLAMIPMFGPPTFFFTVNPSDLNHPLMMYLSGCDVPLRFSDPDNPRMPDYFQRAVRVARDPVAAAQFFHYTIQAFIDCLLGSDHDIDNRKPEQRLGIFGNCVAHYIGKECQNRGSLHAHGVAWISGALHPNAFMSKLRDPGAMGQKFRNQVLDCWRRNVCEMIPGGPLTDEEDRWRDFRRAKFNPMNVPDAIRPEEEVGPLPSARRLRKEQGDKEDALSLADYMQSCSILATAAE